MLNGVNSPFLLHCVFYVNALVGAFNQETALVWAFTMVVKSSPINRVQL